MKNVENQNNKDFYFSILILKKALNLFGMCFCVVKLAAKSKIGHKFVITRQPQKV